jgi:hypothetical protein
VLGGAPWPAPVGSGEAEKWSIVNNVVLTQKGNAIHVSKRTRGRTDTQGETYNEKRGQRFKRKKTLGKGEHMGPYFPYFPSENDGIQAGPHIPILFMLYMLFRML